MNTMISLGFILALLLPATGAAAGLEVTDLKCEYLVNPLGIDVTRPRLSWKLESIDAKARGQGQTAYRILVAGSKERLQANQGDLWDSGRVASDQSIHVEYGGRPLPSRTSCWWKVCAWDQDDRASDWSQPAMWSMGLLAPDDWGDAKWIGLDAPEEGGVELAELKEANWTWYPEGNPCVHAPPETRYFRRTISLPADRTVRRAMCFFAGDDQCSLSVNGAQPPIGTSFGHPDLIGVDVTGQLRPGDNELAVAATNVPSVPRNPAGWITSLKVEFDRGPPLVVFSDGLWKSSKTVKKGWETAAFDEPDWVSAMELGKPGIAPWGMPWQDRSYDDHRRLAARYLRHEFDVQKEVQRATAYVSGLGFFELYLGGRKVGDHVMDPTQSRFDKRAMYVTFDVTDHVRAGKNAVGVILGNGRFFAPRLRLPTATPDFGSPRLLLEMQIEYADGTSEILLSDDRWKVTDDGPIRANNEFDGEEYDARLEQAGWDQAGFDDSDWEPAEVVPAPSGKLIAQMLQPMRVIERLRPVAIRNPKPGVYVADFGQNLYGMVRLKVEGSRGTRVEIRTTFDVHPDGSIDMSPNRSSKSTDVYILKGEGVETWAPRFRGQGARYAAITGFPGVPTRDDVELLVVHSDLEKVGDFTCSNELVNRIHANVVRSVRMQERGVPMDPDRDERQPWLSVSEKTSETEGYVYDVGAFYTSFLGECRIDQRPDGNLSDAGSFWPFYSGDPIWPAVVVTVPHSCYLMYGDRRILEQNYALMKRWVQFQEKRLDADFVHRRGLYGDWVDAYSMDGRVADFGATSRPLMWTAYMYYNCRMLATVADMLGQAEDKEHFFDLSEKIRQALDEEFFDAETGRYESRTQTSYVLPLAFGVVAAEHRQAVIDNLVENILVEHKGHLSVGCVGTKWLMQTLTRIGRTDVAYTILTQTTRPSWGYMVSQDGTSVWERWDRDTRDPGMNGQSQTILIGYLGAWMYQALGGIHNDPERPGFKHIILRPQPVGDLTFVRASHKCMYGTIASDWEIADGMFRWQVAVPPGTTATVHVPAKDAKSVTESGKPADGAEGVEFLHTENGAAVFAVGSGTYRFAAPCDLPTQEPVAQ